MAYRGQTGWKAQKTLREVTISEGIAPSHCSGQRFAVASHWGASREKVKQQLGFSDASVSPLLYGLPARKKAKK